MYKNYPKLRFIISKRQELDTYLAFLEESRYRDNSREMNWAFYKKHPELKILKDKNLTLKKRKTIVRDYVDYFYATRINQIKKLTTKEKIKWQKLEKIFYSLVNDVFGEYKWPKGKYIAYPTIWGMFPRFLDNKTFQFPYQCKKNNFTQVVIAHEMLHFMFYDYVYKKYPKLRNHKYDFGLWNISESFNMVIQNLPKWKKVFGKATMSYPEHKKMIKDLKKLWKETGGDINVFLNKTFKKFLRNEEQ